MQERAGQGPKGAKDEVKWLASIADLRAWVPEGREGRSQVACINSKPSPRQTIADQSILKSAVLPASPMPLFDCVHVLSMFKLWSSKKRRGWRWNHDMGEEVYNLSHSPSQTKGWTKQFAAEKLNFENSFEVKKMNCVNRNLHCPQLCYNVNFLLSTKLDLKDTSKEKKSPSLTNNKPIID